MLITTNKYESIPNILLEYEANSDNDDNYILVSGSLKPQSLELTEFNLDNCETEINSALSEAVTKNKISENIKQLCNLLTKAVVNSKTNSQIDVIKHLLDGNSSKVSADETISIDDKVKSLLSDSYVKNEITKNFGEILGSIFLLKHLKDAKTVFFGKNKSEKVKDYQLQLEDNSYWNVSAKALKRANAPSVSGLIDAINKGGNDTLKNLLVGKDTTVRELKWLVSMLQKENNSKDEWISLVKRYSSEKYLQYEGAESLKVAFEAFREFFSLRNNSDYGADKFSAKFDKKCRNDLKGVKEVISTVWKALGVSDKASVSLTENLEYYISLKPETKVGIFMYPIIKRAVKIMNKSLGIHGDSEKKNIDIFTKVARYYFSGYKQLYLDVDFTSGSVSFTFRMVEMGECDWTLLYDKSTMNDPYTRLQMKVITNFKRKS